MGATDQQQMGVCGSEEGGGPCVAEMSAEQKAKGVQIWKIVTGPKQKVSHKEFMAKTWRKDQKEKLAGEIRNDDGFVTEAIWMAYLRDLRIDSDGANFNIMLEEHLNALNGFKY